MKELLNRFETKAPEIVFEWHDSETPAKGWVVINSLRGGAAGGGTRMRTGLDRREVESLAKTMEVKFAVSGPAIGGAKSGIDFDPADPRKDGVLRRWYKAVTPLLKTYYGTGGDLNVDEVHEVIPITESHGLWHPQEGVVNGHFAPTESERIQKVGQLRKGVAKVVEDPRYTPDAERKFVVADLITGWGVAESVLHHYRLLRREGGGQARDRAGLGQRRLGRGLLPGAGRREGGRHHRPRRRPAQAQGLQLRGSARAVPGQAGQHPGGREHDVLRRDQRVDLERGRRGLPALRGVAPGDARAGGPHGRRAASKWWPAAPTCPLPTARSSTARPTSTPTRKVAVIPDFIANCGMARAFAFLMQGDVEISDEAIFSDVSATIAGALERCHTHYPERTQLARTAFEVTLGQLV